MSSPADRFPIPGGSLELDSYDDEHEDNMAQVHPLPSPPPISSIMHLTPVDLSSVLCRISHPLASRTAEYVRALNLSGNAFRNLDLSALNVLSNHDPAMVNQLLHIQSGVLPCSLPLEEHDGAGNESLSLNASGPSNVDPSKPSFSAESSASDGFSPHSTSTSSSTSVNISPAISESPGPRSLNIQSSGVDDPQSQRSLADPSIAHSNDEVAGLVVPLGHATRSVPGANLDGCCQSLFASCATVTTTSGSEPSMNPQRSEAKMSTASSGTDTLQPLPDQPSTVSNEMAVQVRSLDGSTPSHLSPSIQPKSPQVDGSAESELETHCNAVDSGAHGAFSQAEASSDVSAGVSGETGTLNSGQGTSPSVTANNGFSESDISSLDQSGAMSKIQGPPDLSYSARPTSPIHVSNAPDKSPADSDPNERGLFSGPTSAPLSQRDIVTSASSTSCSVLETPPIAAEPDRGGDSSFLEFDLLHFSPFSLPAQLVHVHDTQMPSSELGKVGACPLSGGTADLMTCEEESQFRIGSASATSSKIALCPKEIVSIHGFTSNPFHSTAESQSTPADLRDVGAHPPHYKNINHGNGDGSPAFYMDEAASECRHDHVNHVGSDVYSTCSQAETAVDSLCHYGIEEGSGTCDDNSLGQVSLVGSSPSSDSSSARPCVSPSPVRGGLQGSSSPPRSTGDEVQFPTGATAIRPKRADKDSSSRSGQTCGPSTVQPCPPLLRLVIPIAGASLQEELFQLSPLFSPTSETNEDSKFERLFSESSFSASRTQERLPVKLKRGAQRIARHSRGTDTSDLEPPPTMRVLVGASVQTDEDWEVEHLRRRVKALERELRSLRTRKRSEERARDSKPKSFWSKVASTDRVVPSPKPLKFSLKPGNLSSVTQSS